MKIEESTHEGVPLLRISGEVDHLTAPRFQAGIERSLGGETVALLVDLTQCPFMDSGGLNVLLRAVLRQQESGAWLGVIGANSSLMRIFEIVGLTTKQEFRLFTDLAEIKSSRRKRS